MPTKYYNNNNRPKPYADRPIPISTSEDDYDDGAEVLICPSCRCNTVTRYDDHDHCSRCQRTFNVKQEVESADIVESESMDSHNETLISNLPDPLDQYRSKRHEVQGAFKTLQDKGIRITSYSQRSGEGHITSSWNERSGSSISDQGQQRRSTPRPTRPTPKTESEE
jgi:hypothetical protein